MWVETLLLVTLCARSSKFGLTLSGLRCSALNWDLRWELLIPPNVWDASKNRADLSLVALRWAQSVVSICLRHLSKENPTAFPVSSREERISPSKYRQQVASIRTYKDKEFHNWLTHTGLPGGLCGAGKWHSTQVYSFTWSWILFSGLTFFFFKFCDPPSLHQRIRRVVYQRKVFSLSL